MASLHLSGVTKRYGDQVVVDDVSLDVRDGEFLVLLGPSGCGKTTTLRIMAGFAEATAGSVRIGARDVTREPPYRRNLGLVFQNYALFPHLTVFENVAFGLRRRRVAEPELATRVGEALELVRLGGLGGRLPRQLSGGQQQRVAIARAVAIRPDVLLLDEPLSNLDAKLRHDVRAELKRLQATLGTTTIMVTHDQDEAMALGDRLVVLQGGRVQQVGSPHDLYRRPQNRFVASFIGRANFLPGEVAPDGATFRTPSGLAVAGEALLRTADTLMIRPEAVALARERGPGPNVFPATIEVATFLGAAQDLDLRLDSGDAVSAILPTRSGLPDWSTGERVFVTVDPSAAIGIRDSELAATVVATSPATPH